MAMQVVNIKELKAKLSAYLRDVARGASFLVTDRGRVVARLGPDTPSPAPSSADTLAARLTSIGARPPMRGRATGDYLRPGTVALPTEAIDDLLDWSRGERHEGS